MAASSWATSSGYIPDSSIASQEASASDTDVDWTSRPGAGNHAAVLTTSARTANSSAGSYTYTQHGTFVPRS